ncbi:hypothetical protein V6N11_046686 [Hibiscus sabdariffa]|uniref:RIN4 pathogenic type III effector avirulence factor Avr cleavage site domain-containing protein n=1 Tax=Hibiscus sabdariffa TaxID=183260 RepID=A0ABR2P2X8_9ROSI
MAQQRGKPLPKFGEWDVNNPATAEGFTVIFNNARDEKKTRGKAVNAMSSASSKKTDIPPSPPTPKLKLQNGFHCHLSFLTPIPFIIIIIIIISPTAHPKPYTLPSALLFDCDGVLVDTEKDGHRVSFNDTFIEKELGVTWDVDLYEKLLKIAGGKERLLPLRPGVAKLVDQALDKGVKVAVCSTSNEKAVSAVVSCLLGPERAEKIQIFAGDVAIYTLAANTLNVEPSSSVVVEDGAIGLAAAKAAGMTCIVTKSGYTADEDFLNADAVFDCIGDPPEEKFDLAFCASLLERQYVS